MKILILGTPDSGKSLRAEELTLSLSPGRKRAYLATMIPYGEEGKARVKKHRDMRKEKNFFTYEKPTHLEELSLELKEQNYECVLLECMANLTGNEIYAHENQGLSDEALVNLILKEVLQIGEVVKHLIIVTNEFEPNAPTYDDETRRYVKILNRVNQDLIKHVDRYDIKKNKGWSIYENH